jgi:hypothetical protein
MEHQDDPSPGVRSCCHEFHWYAFGNNQIRALVSHLLATWRLYARLSGLCVKGLRAGVEVRPADRTWLENTLHELRSVGRIRLHWKRSDLRDACP